MIENRGEMGVDRQRGWEGARFKRMDDVSGKTVTGSSSYK
jgi:hypothetical protein